jgi:AAA-like domain/FHA domain
MNPSDTVFYITGGTLQSNAPCYVERRADKDVYGWLLQSEFCYVLTSRQMGKSSLMVRATNRLRQAQVNVIAVDLQGLGFNNLTPDQWYFSLLLKMGQDLRLEDEAEDYWHNHDRLGPVKRLFSAVREVILTRRSGQVVIFIDEIDTVRGLPFATDEFFAAIRECYNRRSEDAEFNRLTFCLLGVATPSELIRNPLITPFNIGHRIELTDFTEIEAAPLTQKLSRDPTQAQDLLKRIIEWTNGHPYLTQRLCRAVAELDKEQAPTALRDPQTIDALAEKLFLSPRAREQDDNLLFVRERILRAEADLARLLGLYEQILKGERVPDDETDDLINQLRLAGIVDVAQGLLRVRNQIYARVFDEAWVGANAPDAELEKPGGARIRLRGTCTLGRASTSDIVLADAKVSRRHALVQPQKQYEFWLLDLGSANGTYLNGRRITQPVLLRDRDQIEVGPFRLVFRQSKTAFPGPSEQTSADQTIFAERLNLRQPAP